MQKIYKLKVTMFLVLMWVTVGHAETFCVANGEELQTALSTASSNNQADHIKLKVGVFEGALSGFDYFGSQENYDLEVSGNWGASNTDDCGSRLLPIDQFGSSQVLANFQSTGSSSIFDLTTGVLGDVSISHLLIRTGETFNSNSAGLDIDISDGYSGRVLIENNTLHSNYSEEGAVLKIRGLNLVNPGTVVVRNNFVRDNDSNSPVYIYLSCGVSQDIVSGLYFTNNTVYDNDSSSNSTNLPTGVKIDVDRCSVFIANNLLWGYADIAGGDSDLVLRGDGYKYLFNNDIGFMGGDNADESSGNFSAAPTFVNEGFPSNFRPAPNSPVINAGIMPPTNPNIPPQFDENWDLGALDLYGQARVNQGIVDVGAVESDVIFIDDFE